ncbi:hypothetical protein B7463_g5317, partial [Scytalidium lignicola]
MNIGKDAEVHHNPPATYGGARYHVAKDLSLSVEHESIGTIREPVVAVKRHVADPACYIIFPRQSGGDPTAKAPEDPEDSRTDGDEDVRTGDGKPDKSRRILALPASSIINNLTKYTAPHQEYSRTACNRPQMLDCIVEDRVHNDRDRFIESIKENDICSLASSYHHNDPCSFFKPPARGSYNICFFVRFHARNSEQRISCDGEKREEGDSWVVRVPLSPCLAFGAHEKLESEIAAIERLEFTSIGTLSRGSKGVDIDVRKMPISISINEQELESLQPSQILKEHGDCESVLTSSNDYVSMLLRLTQNAFEKGRKSVYNEEDGNETLYYLHQFFQFVEEKWLDSTLDKGPFLLVHGDLNPYNLIVNENFDIMALLDWEWSHVVPVQFFMPPTWLTGRGNHILAWPVQYREYIKELDKFRRITEIEYFAARFLDKILYNRKDLEGRIKEFMIEDPTLHTLVARKILDHIAYREERKRLEIEDLANDEIGDEIKRQGKRHL